MRSMQLQNQQQGQQQQNGNQSAANTPFAQPQTPVNNIQSLSLDNTLSPAQLTNTSNNNNATAQSSPRTAVLQGSQQMQRNQSRSTGIGVGSGSMLPPQSPANRTTTPKPIGVGIGVGVGKATPKMVKEELVCQPMPLGTTAANIIEGYNSEITPTITKHKQRNSPYSRPRRNDIHTRSNTLSTIRINDITSSTSQNRRLQYQLQLQLEHKPKSHSDYRSSGRRVRPEFLCRFRRYEFPRWRFRI
jgi:hypothetical protein